MTARDLMKDVNETLGYAGEIVPELQAGFMSFNKQVLSSGALDVKTKELIAIATSLTSTCEWCITYHTKMALDAGATRNEIMEASFVAVLMGGAPALMHVKLVKDAVEAFAKR